MKKHRTCKERSVKINFAYYKTFKKEKEVPKLVQQLTSQRCFEGEFAIGTTMHCPYFFLKEEMKKKKKKKTYNLNNRKT
jgi:hypothetical protein